MEGSHWQHSETFVGSSRNAQTGTYVCTVHEKNHLRTFECSRKINSREVGLMQNIIKRMREIIAQYRARSSRNVVRDGDLRTYVRT